MSTSPSAASCTPPTCTPPSSWGVSAFRLDHAPTVATAMSAQQEVPRPFSTVDVPDHAHYTIGSVILAIGITGIIGNLLVIYAFSRSRSLRTPPNMFIINLAVTDLLMCVTQAPVFFTTSMHRRWIFGERACEVYAFCGALFGITSMVTLMVIAVDRYFVITRPLASIGALSRKRAAAVLGGAWTYALGWSLPPFFGWSAYIPEGLLTSCTWDYMTFSPSVRAYTMLLFTCVFLLPLGVIIYCYVHIFRAIRSTNQAVAGVVISRESVKTFHRLQNEWKMAKIALIVILLYVVSWSPYSAVALTAFAGYADMLTPYMNSVPAVIAKASAIHNPIIYAITHPKYRIALAKYIPYLGVLLCVQGRDLRSAGSSFVSTRRSTVSSQTSDVSARYRRSSAGGRKARLSSASDSESGWTDTEADLSSTSSRPASRQVSCELGGDTAEMTTPDFKISSSSSNSFKSSDWLQRNHDSGIFDSDVPVAGTPLVATNGDIIAEGHARRATIGRIPSIVVTAETVNPFLPQSAGGGRTAPRSSSRSKPTNSTAAGAGPHRSPSPPSV